MWGPHLLYGSPSFMLVAVYWQCVKGCRPGGSHVSAQVNFYVYQAVGEGEISQEGVQAQDRKALRKAKNRASAAASRARREAYTASLETEVHSCPAFQFSNLAKHGVSHFADVT